MQRKRELRIKKSSIGVAVFHPSSLRNLVHHVQSPVFALPSEADLVLPSLCSVVCVFKVSYNLYTVTWTIFGI